MPLRWRRLFAWITSEERTVRRSRLHCSHAAFSAIRLLPHTVLPDFGPDVGLTVRVAYYDSPHLLYRHLPDSTAILTDTTAAFGWIRRNYRTHHQAAAALFRFRYTISHHLRLPHHRDGYYYCCPSMNWTLIYTTIPAVSMGHLFTPFLH